MAFGNTRHRIRTHSHIRTPTNSIRFQFDGVFQQQQTLLMCAARNRRARPEVLEGVLGALGAASAGALEAQDNEGRTPLHHAAAAGHARLVRRLARAGASLNSVDNVCRQFCIFIFQYFFSKCHIYNRFQTMCVLSSRCYMYTNLIDEKFDIVTYGSRSS